MSELRFDGRVVIVTGAGGGLGRSHALLCASRGARVVINDLGGSMHGGGKSGKAADAVVAEIKAAGGEAVANYDSVEDGDKIVETALDTWGQLDVVINNAGILRDTSFQKMSVEDWELIQRIHVNGSFRVTHAAWNHMRDRGYGRIVMTASAAGIYGNFGQANYSAAKLGLAGFASTLALEGRKRGVHVNTIAPIAGSRLTETVMPKEIVDALKPEYVSPLVLWLCHESCTETGGLFEVGGGFMAKLRWERSRGELVRLGRAITPELVKKSWSKITSFEGATHPADIQQSMQPIMENVQAGPTKGGNELVDADLALGYEYPEQRSTMQERDAALYALAIGAANDPLDENDLKLVYELSGGFTTFPTYAVIPPMRAMIELMQAGHQVPGLNYGVDRLLHGEQYTEVVRPLPRSAKLTHRIRIKEIWDKGKGAVINTEAKTYDETGELVAINEYVSFIRGAGGFGGERGPSTEQNAAPERAPDKVVEQRVSPSQALLYRLTGDINPLHADPSFARAFGFERPILHGLCTFGFAARHVVASFAKEGDARYFKSIRVRFVKSVLPGDTLVTEMWQESAQKIVFRCKVKERDEVVLSNAAIELYEAIPQPKAKAAAQVAAAQPAAGQAPAGAANAASGLPTSGDIFAAISAFIAKTPELVGKVGKVFQFKLSEPASTFTVDVKNGAGGVGAGETTKADCTLELTDANFLAMCTGQADAQKLYFGGELKIGGDIMASQKLTFLKKLDPALVLDAMKARAGGGAAAAAGASSTGGSAAGSAGGTAQAVTAGTAQAATAGSAGKAEACAPKVQEALAQRIAKNPALAGDVQAIVQFVVREPDAAFTVSLTPGAVGVTPGTAQADATLSLCDADLGALARGEVTAQTLYQHGKLRLDGDAKIAQRLGFLNKLMS